MTYISAFDDVGPGDVALAGGKGPRPGGLVRAGLPVPPGFVLTTAADAELVDANHLQSGIRELAALAPQASPEDYENASERIRALFTGGTMDAGTVYYTAVQSIIPIAATSEISFGAFYGKFVRRDGDPPAQAFLLGYDSEPIRAEKSLFHLAAWARGVPGLAAAILNEPTAALAESQRDGTPPAGFDPTLWRRWHPRFQDHLSRFGHAVYNLDFVSPVPADDPSAPLETVK